jgi:hypothetical protein
MAASTLTKGAWTSASQNGLTVWTCTVTATTADYDIYTLKTPKDLDVNEPWCLYVNAASATLDDTATAMPVDLYVGFDDGLALSANHSPTVSHGVLYKEDIYDDVRTAVGYIQMFPNIDVAEDVAGVAAKCYIPIAPYYAFNIDGASVVSAGDCVFKIIQ